MTISFLPRKLGRAKGTRIRALLASFRDILRLWFKWVVLGKRNCSEVRAIERFYPEVEVEIEKIYQP